MVDAGDIKIEKRRKPKGLGDSGFQGQSYEIMRTNN
jgi:hypothetical protein